MNIILEQTLKQIPVNTWKTEQVIVLDWYDAPRTGFCKMAVPEVEFYFTVFADRYVEDSLDDHLYTITCCPVGTSGFFALAV